MTRDLICVYHAADMGEADIVVAWLEQRGVAAEVRDRLTAGTLSVPQIVAPQGIEVCVVDPQQADRARDLLRDHRQEIADAHKSGDEGQPIEVACDECGQSASFPFAQRGSVQECPHCGEYVDVPDAKAS